MRNAATRHAEDAQYTLAPVPVELHEICENRDERSPFLALPPDVDRTAVEPLRRRSVRSVRQQQYAVAKVVDDHLQMREKRPNPLFLVRPPHHDDVRPDRIKRMALQYRMQRHVEFRRDDHSRKHLPLAFTAEFAQSAQPLRAQFTKFEASRLFNDLDHTQDPAVLAEEQCVFDKVAAFLGSFKQNRDGRTPILRVARQPRQLKQHRTNARIEKSAPRGTVLHLEIPVSQPKVESADDHDRRDREPEVDQKRRDRAGHCPINRHRPVKETETRPERRIRSVRLHERRDIDDRIGEEEEERNKFTHEVDWRMFHVRFAAPEHSRPKQDRQHDQDHHHDRAARLVLWTDPLAEHADSRQHIVHAEAL